MLSLSGDPEIDATLPQRPRVIHELIWFILDRERLLVIGTLNGLIAPQRFGDVTLVDFANKADGTRTIEELVCDADGQIDEERRLALLLLFSRGLIEDALDDGTDENMNVPALPFLARIMDQTRACRSRRSLVDHVRRPIGLVAAPDTVVTFLRTSGVNSFGCSLASTDSNELTVIFVEPATDFSLVERLRRASQPILLISAERDELRIGPMLLGPGTTSLSICRQIHSGNSDQGAYADLWDIVVANAILLIHSRTAPVSLLNQYIRYRRTDTGLESETMPLMRRVADSLESSALDRLARQSAVAVLPARYSGYKAYEVHYSPSYLAASQLVLRPADANDPSTATAFPQDLLKALEIGFGYRTNGNALVRNCPTGGNLGSPEAMVVDFDAELGLETLYRFVSCPASLERVAQCAWPPPPGSSSYRVVASIGNAAKLRFKYKALGDNVVHLDAGIASSFFGAAVASLTGLTPRFELHRINDGLLGRYLAIRQGVYTQTWRTKIPSSVDGRLRSASDSTAFGSLLDVVEQRRATRELLAADLGEEDMRTLLQSMPCDFEETGREILSLFRLIFFINERGRSLTLLFSVSDGELSFEPLPRVVDRGQMISQTLLAQAPAKLFFFVDLPELLRRYGHDGHDNALALCGAWIGRLWLKAHMQGLAGCPAGAVAESEILSQLEPAKAESWFSLSCFALGRSAKQQSNLACG
jgi:hypothetical protein